MKNNSENRLTRKILGLKLTEFFAREFKRKLPKLTFKTIRK